MPAKKGLYANIQAKRKRIAKGSGEKMRQPGEEGAPSKQDFRKAEKTAKKPPKKTKSKTSAKSRCSLCRSPSRSSS